MKIIAILYKMWLHKILRIINGIIILSEFQDSSIKEEGCKRCTNFARDVRFFSLK
jgi:hypothetical protein